MRVTDPVCGMEIDSATAAAVEVHEGRCYVFCSARCRDAFLRDAERYVVVSPPGEARQPEGDRR